MKNNKFGKALAALRIKQKISQEELADRLDLHRTYISQIERGLKSPSLRVLDRIADYFNLKLSQLFKIVEDHRDA